MSRATSQSRDYYDQSRELEAGGASHNSQESTVNGRLHRLSAFRKTSTKATNERQSSRAVKDERDRLWDEVYAKIDDGSCEYLYALDHLRLGKVINNACLKIDEKYPEGWPRLASFLDGCASFSIFRRFGHCATRILVDYTTRITMLEKKLHDLDKSDALPNGNRYRLRNLEVGPDTFKQDLLASIEECVRKYYDFLLLYSRVRGMGQTSKDDYDSVFQWVHQNKPVDKGQYDFIYHSEDFVSPVPRQKRNAVEALLWKYLNKWPNGWMMRTLGLDRTSKQPREEIVRYISKERILNVAKLIIAVLAVTILYTPIALFLLVPMSKACMSITVLVFLAVFALIISVFAEVGVQEIFIGTATYGAVMVTFLGNLRNSMPAAIA